MEDIDILEETIERNSEITIETFQSAYEREKRDIFQKQMLPIVKHLRLCATRWEHELQKEVKTMINVFESSENTILVQKQRQTSECSLDTVKIPKVFRYGIVGQEKFRKLFMLILMNSRKWLLSNTT
jgi:hypothetical protein